MGVTEVPGGPRCWRTSVAGTARAGNRRRTLVPDEARAGGPCGGTVPPHPSQVAALRGRPSGLLLAGLCAAGHRWRARAPSPDRQPWQRGPWRWPAPGSRTRLPIAAAFFFLLKKRNVIPAGPRQGWAPAPSPLHAMGPPLTWPCPPGLGTRGKEEEKPKMPQQPAALRPGAVQHVLLPGVRAGTGAQGGAQAPAGAPLQHTALRKTPQKRCFLFSTPRQTPKARCARSLERRHP